MISLDDVHAAAARLHGVAERTPLVISAGLNESLGTRVVCKAENRQRTGAFKFRGAYNHVMGIDAETRSRGVVGASSGNHAQALALSAQLAGINATVVVPRDIPASKLQAIRCLGPEVVFYDRTTTDRDLLVAEIARTKACTVVPSSESSFVLAGNGTIALELLEDASDIDTLLVPIGGGGLAAGCAIVIKQLRPDIKVIGVEPESANDTQLSLQQGHLMSIPSPSTIADGLRHRTPGAAAFEINQRLLFDLVTVSDSAIAHAMALCWQHFGMRVEPSGACALAGLLSPRMSESHKRVAVILSGGNVEEDIFRWIVATNPWHTSKPCGE